MSKHTIIFVQGAGAHDEDHKLADSLQNVLGADYDVVYPRMPDEESPTYNAWKQQITQSIADADGSIILAGHSFGASMLLKVLAVEQSPKPISGVFLIATPYWRDQDWDVSQYTLPDELSASLTNIPTYLYHNRDDEVVSFSHLGRYVEKLPNAIVREFDEGGHQFNDDLSAVAADIKRLMKAE
jgi:predicted alpha/beta hydrolase family esterase